ncbi:MAG: YbjN domain-containing protein [Spirochaetales bacterium]|nr:YbjN domain-containing protein [Spirochaetales bacterium]
MNDSKVESYLINLGVTYERVTEGTWVINDDEKGLEQVVILLEEPLIVLRVRVMETPSSNREALFQQLLKLNATDVIHGAYALDGNDVILIDTLQYDSMDFNDFQSSLDAIGLALAQHYPILSQFREK